MFEVADARHLPFPDNSFDLILTSPPFDAPRIVRKCRREWSRVVKPGGRIALIWRDEIEVYDDRWALLGTTHAPPQTKPGVDYFETPEWAVRILLRDDPAESVLDPFCGTGTIPRVAASLGKRTGGTDINPAAIEEARRRSFPRSILQPVRSLSAPAIRSGR